MSELHKDGKKNELPMKTPEEDWFKPRPGFHAGIVSLIGRSNVGKSTLLNTILGRKVAIISPKPQTTRNRITGIFTRDDGQIVFWDTPGFHRPKFELNKRMISIALASLREVDCVCWVIDVTTEAHTHDNQLLHIIQQIQNHTPVVLVINKIDKINKIELLPIIDRYRMFAEFKEIVPVSALKGTNIPQLVDVLIQLLPESPPLFPPHQWTDASPDFLIAELIREKLLRYLRKEVPYCTAVEIRHIEEREEKDILVVFADIWVEKQSQKAILIGKKGSMIKQIGMKAREEIEALFGKHVYLDLRVKVKKKWRQRPSDLARLGILIP